MAQHSLPRHPLALCDAAALPLEGKFGTRTHVCDYVVAYNETAVRPTALAVSPGIGRLDPFSELTKGWLFDSFEASGAIGGVACAAVPRRRRHTSEASSVLAVSPDPSSQASHRRGPQ